MKALAHDGDKFVGQVGPDVRKVTVHDWPKPAYVVLGVALVPNRNVAGEHEVDQNADAENI